MRQIDYFKTYWLVSPQTYIKDQCCLHQKLYVWFYQSSTTEIPWDTMHAHGWSFYLSNRHLVAWLVFNWVFSRQSTSGRDLCGNSVPFHGDFHLSMENSMDGLLEKTEYDTNFIWAAKHTLSFWECSTWHHHKSTSPWRSQTSQCHMCRTTD